MTVVEEPRLPFDDTPPSAGANPPSLPEGSQAEDLLRELEGGLSTLEQDAIGEIGNIAFGTAATTLSTLLGQKVEITTPNVRLLKKDVLAQEFTYPHVGIMVDYTEGLQGKNVFVLRVSDALVISSLMLGEGPKTEGELDELRLSAVQEAMNQMMGSTATSMATLFGRRVYISPTSVKLQMIPPEGEALPDLPDGTLVVVSFRLKIGTLVDSSFVQLVPLIFAKEMTRALFEPHGEGIPDSLPSAEEIPPSAPASSASGKVPPSTPEGKEVVSSTPKAESGPTPSSGGLGAPAEHVERSSASEPPRAASAGGQVVVRPVEFAPLEGGGGEGDDDERNLGLLYDVELEVTVELGRTRRRVRDILAFRPGSIVELDKLAGEPVDIYVNNKHIARGEVVVIDENFGVRITELVGKLERVR
ncbi:MAG TPA: flagellar motor switch phosphatase FliY [Bacillaceae bacterium]|nr:flagellar motor switch phosphatase FliY [Bacillaceae bacterium]